MGKKTKKESEDEMAKKPTHRVGGKLVKEDEDEDEEEETEDRRDNFKRKSKEDDEDSADRYDEDHDEAGGDKESKKAKKEAEDEEALDEDEKKSFRAMKEKIKAHKMRKAGTSLNPEESGEESTSDSHSTTPGKMTGAKQDVFNPSSDVDGKRTQSTPMDGMHKSVAPDMTKSPLFISLNKQMDEMKDVVSKKFESALKSMNDRMINLEKGIKAIENMPLYKAASTDGQAAPVEANESLAKKAAEGKIKFSK